MGHYKVEKNTKSHRAVDSRSWEQGLAEQAALAGNRPEVPEAAVVLVAAAVG